MARQNDRSAGLAGTRVTRRSLLGATVGGASLLGLSGMLSACGAGNSTATNGTLRIAIGDSSPSDKLDPALATSVASTYLTNMIFEPLVILTENFEIEPGLAERWDVNNGGAEWVFHLRADVSFHDGTPLTAADAAWTLTRILDENLASPLFAPLSANLEPGGIEVVDERTLRLTLTQPNLFLGETVGNTNAGVVKANQDSFSVADAHGTGPFKVSAFTPGESFEVVRHGTYYRKGVPAADKIQNSKIDPSAAMAALSSGALDWTDALDSKTVARLKGDKRFTAPGLEPESPALRTYFLHMKLDEAPFNDPRVVMAMKVAADRGAIQQAVLSGLGSITGDVPTPQTDPLYPSEIGDRAQDVAKARQLLAEAGFPDGIDVDLPTANIQPGMVDFSVAYAETVKSAGIRVNIRQVPADTYFDKVFGKEPMFHDYGLRRSALEMMENFFAKGGAYNATGFDADGKVSGMLAAARTETDEAKRDAILTEALGYVADNSGSIVAFWVPILDVMRSGIEGDLHATRFGWDRMKVVS